VRNLRPFRFGVYLRSGATRPEGSETQGPPSFDAQKWRQLARRVEHLGFAVLSVPDHFGAQPAPMAAMMAALDATTSLRVTTGVLDNDFRHPLVVAREVATMDVLSGGRVELGLGAGWLKSDYQASGIGYDPVGVRLSRLEEAVTIIKQAWQPGRNVFSGTFYQVDDDSFPKPAQSSVPLMIGGGSPRILRIAGREASIVSINLNLGVGSTLGPGEVLTPDRIAGEVDVEAYFRKVGWVREGAGPRFDDLEIQISPYLTAVTHRPNEVLDRLAQEMGTPAATLAEAPALLVGSADAIADKLVGLREQFGFSYVTFDSNAFESAVPVVERLAGT
jgi:probable F420-dependent oxidoreductase